MKTAVWAVAVATSTMIASASEAVDFNRPNFALLQIGKANIAETIAAFGPPFRRGPGDDPATTVLIYRYDARPEAQTADFKILAVTLLFDAAGVLKEKHFYKLADDRSLR